MVDMGLHHEQNEGVNNMKRFMLLGVIAALLVCATATSTRGSYISSSQRVYFTYYSSSYWAMVYDYSNAYRESATPGYITYSGYLTYNLGYWDVQVAYIYDTYYGRYIEALALRDVVL